MDTVDLNGVDFLWPGKWNGKQYTLADLRDILDAFNQLRGVFHVPIKLGHDDSQGALNGTAWAQQDGQPALGWIRRLYFRGNRLAADLARVPKQFAALIQAGAYRGRSAEIWFDTEFEGKRYRRVLAALSFLGADAPAVSSLNDVVNLYGRAPEPAAQAALAAAARRTVTVSLTGAQPMPRKETLAGASFDDIRSAVQSALTAAYGTAADDAAAPTNDGPSDTIVDLYADAVIVSDLDGDSLYSIPYTIDTGTATLGQPQMVKVTYTPISGEQEPDADDTGELPKENDPDASSGDVAKQARLLALAGRLSRSADVLLAQAGDPAQTVDLEKQRSKLLSAIDQFVEQLNAVAGGKSGVATMRTLMNEVKRKLAGMKLPQPAQHRREGDLDAMERAKLAKIFGLPETATDAELEAAAVAAKAGRVDLSAHNEALERLARLEKDKEDREVSELLAGAIRDGKILAKNRAECETLARENRAAFEAYLKVAPKVVKLGAAAGSETETTTAPPEERVALARKLGLSVEELDAWDRPTPEAMALRKNGAAA